MNTKEQTSGVPKVAKRLGWCGLAALLLVGLSTSPVHAGVTVTLTAPADGTVYNAPAGSITLSATASATQGYTLSKVEFFHGGTNLIASDTTSPYSFDWTNVPAGTYAITAVATAVKKSSPNQTATSATHTIIVNAPPSVSITTPAANAVFGVGGFGSREIAIGATASDPNGTISTVQFFYGATTLIGTDLTAPYTTSFFVNAESVGNYSLTSVATDNHNASTTSSAVPITVTLIPNAAIESPSNLSVFAAPANIAITASASDSDGIALVEILANWSEVLASFTAPPYTFNWQNVPPGQHTLSVRATDNLGATNWDIFPPPPHAVTVTNPPMVTLTSPTSGASFNGSPVNVTLTATASDSDGSIQKVEFFHGGTNLIATLTAAPYTFEWQNVSAGNYSLTAVATDNNNIQTTSAPSSISVNQQAALFFIHTDHLNTPRAITNATGQLVWSWANDDPFGANAPNENPAGAGQFTCNLRLPGQYFDKETNLHYNYFRDYDSGIGRYVQSDPIGLNGGLNTYAYVFGNPLVFSDPTGLLGSRPRPSDQIDTVRAAELGYKCATKLPCSVLQFGGYSNPMISDECLPALSYGYIECTAVCRRALEKKCVSKTSMCGVAYEY